MFMRRGREPRACNRPYPREGDAGASEAPADLDRPLTPQNDENDNSDHFLWVSQAVGMIMPL